jgi:hypothetical protein
MIDRHDVLFWGVLMILVTLAAVFIALIPNEGFASVYGIQVITCALILSALGCICLGICYRWWPPTKPQFEYVVNFDQEPEDGKMREIDVRLPSGEIMKRRANFFIVRVGVPAGSENAEEVKLFYQHPNSTDIFELQRIQPTGVPNIIVQWASPNKFADVPEKFASALLDAREGKLDHLTLVSGEKTSTLVPLVVFFTVEGSNDVYFVSPYRRSYIMPMKFQTSLYIVAKGRSQKLLRSLEIDAHKWDNVAVTGL